MPFIPPTAPWFGVASWGYCRNRATTRCTIKRRGNCFHWATGPFFPRSFVLCSFCSTHFSICYQSSTLVLCFVVCTLFFCVVLRLLTISRSLASLYCIVERFSHDYVDRKLTAMYIIIRDEWGVAEVFPCAAAAISCKRTETGKETDMKLDKILINKTSHQSFALYELTLDLSLFITIILF